MLVLWCWCHSVDCLGGGDDGVGHGVCIMALVSWCWYHGVGVMALTIWRFEMMTLVGWSLYQNVDVMGVTVRRWK